MSTRITHATKPNDIALMLQAAADAVTSADKALSDALKAAERKTFPANVNAHANLFHVIFQAVVIYTSHADALRMSNRGDLAKLVAKVIADDATDQVVADELATFIGSGSRQTVGSRAMTVGTMHARLIDEPKVAKRLDKATEVGLRDYFVSVHADRTDIAIGIAKYVVWLRAMAAKYNVMRTDDKPFTSKTQLGDDDAIMPTEPKPATPATFAETVARRLKSETDANVRKIVRKAPADLADVAMSYADSAADLYRIAESFAALAYMVETGKPVADVFASDKAKAKTGGK